MTCFSLGIILSVTKKEEEIALELKEKQTRKDILEKLIDEQIKKEESLENDDDLEESDEIKGHSITENNTNPMTAIEGIRIKKQ